MSRFSGFIGGAYSGRAISSDAESSINFYPESVESQGGADNSPTILLSKPGLRYFTNLTGGASSVQALLSVNGRCFAVGGNAFWEVFSGGTVTNRGAIAGDTRPQLSANQTQVLILAGGMGYIFTLATNALVRVTSSGWPQGADKLAFLDGYFIALESASQTFAISAINDGTTWSALDFGSAEGQQGNMVTMICDQRQVWFQADSHTEIYYDSGSASFPIVRLSGAFMDQGSAAIDGGCKVDNSIMWLGGNPDGAGIVWRANGYTPQRVSSHAVENALQSYPTLSDATAYCYQDGGHTFYVLTLPSANGGLGVTWVYDVASGYWHVRGWWNASLGTYQADLARCHAFAFGQHLVGDYQSGNIYVMSQSVYTDNGTLIRRERTAPDLANGGDWTFYSEFTLTLESGVGLDGAGSTAVAGTETGSGGTGGSGGTTGLPGLYSILSVTSNQNNTGSAYGTATGTIDSADFPSGLTVNYIHAMVESATYPGAGTLTVFCSFAGQTKQFTLNALTPEPSSPGSYQSAIMTYQMPVPVSLAVNATWTAWTEYSTTDATTSIELSSTSLPQGF